MHVGGARKPKLRVDISSTDNHLILFFNGRSFLLEFTNWVDSVVSSEEPFLSTAYALLHLDPRL